MKKLFLCLLICLSLCLSFSVLASAESETFPYVTDAAKLLTEQQAQTLEAEAARIAERYGCAVNAPTVSAATTTVRSVRSGPRCCSSRGRKSS